MDILYVALLPYLFPLAILLVAGVLGASNDRRLGRAEGTLWQRFWANVFACARSSQRRDEH